MGNGQEDKVQFGVTTYSCHHFYGQIISYVLVFNGGFCRVADTVQVRHRLFPKLFVRLMLILQEIIHSDQLTSTLILINVVKLKEWFSVVLALVN